MNTPTSQSITTLFQQTFGQAPVVIARAPGRVEFIGNHTDYNGGAVLGAAIDRYVWVAALPGDGPDKHRPRSSAERWNNSGPASGRLRLASASGHGVLELPADPGTRITGSDSWANYPLGVWRSLGDFSLPRPAAFDLLVVSDLPSGAGLSSSAALELATTLALLALVDATLEPARLAALGRHAENRYVGVPCGILDQGTSAHGRAGHLVHIDCRGPVFSLEPFPASAHLWIFNTREKHALIDGLYATRHQECLDAAKALGVALLADLTPVQLVSLAGRLAPDLAKRAQHVIAEHARVHDTAAALERGDLAAVGRLLTASHRSSQHLFENSTPALDALVDLLEPHPAVLGARLTGGGFGGAVMALTKDTFTEKDAAEVARRHAARHGREPEVIHLQSADGAAVIWRA